MTALRSPSCGGVMCAADGNVDEMGDEMGIKHRVYMLASRAWCGGGGCR